MLKILASTVLLLALTLAMPSHADKVEGVYSCSSGTLVKIGGRTYGFHTDESALSDSAYLGMLKTVLSLMETQNNEVRYETMGYTSACNKSYSRLIGVGG